jgi:aminoglycoside 2''-phosphotransferase
MDEVTKYPPSKPETLLSRIHAAFPELTWKSYKLITEGWDHEVIILDNQTVFRFPNDEHYAAALRTEIAVLRKLRLLSKIAIPDYTYIANDYSFAGYPIIPGKLLHKKLFDDLHAAQQQALARQLADFLTTLHRISTEDQDWAALPNSYVPDDQIKIKQLAVTHLAQALSEQDYAGVQHILAEVDSLVTRQTPIVLLHGDVYSAHLLWDGAHNTLGLIDFSDMARGDPAIDFAELYEYGSRFVGQVYELYNGPKDETFLERAWVYQQWVGVYMMTDHFVTHKTSFAVARKTFDRVKDGLRNGSGS